jgi:multiple sugar transport system substrate-binding protein
VTITFANEASSEASTQPFTEKLIAGFEATYPNIKVKSVPIAFSDMLKELTIMVTSGNAPDVSDPGGSTVPALQAGGVLAQLDSYDPTLLKRFIPSALTKNTFNGGLYALTWDVGPFGFFYNRDLMTQAGLDPTKPPTTLDEMKADMVLAKAKIPNVVPFGLDTTIRDFGLDAEWGPMNAFGAVPYANGKADANTPQMIAYLDWVRGLMKDGLSLPGKKLGQFRPLAANNTLLFGWDAPVFKGIVQSIDTKLTDDAFYKRWGVTGFPAGADGKHYTVDSDSDLVMFEASTKKDASWCFMAYVATNETAVKTYTVPIGLLPPVSDLYPKFPELGNPMAKAFLSDVAPGTIAPPWGPTYSQVATIITTQIQRAYATNDSSADIAATIQDQLSKVAP